MPDIPQPLAPFQIAGGDIVTVEQDSAEDIGSCVYNIAVCPIGARLDLPTFGIPDPTFSPMPIDATPIVQALIKWEPRADITAKHTEDFYIEAQNLYLAVAPAQASEA